MTAALAPLKLLRSIRGFDTCVKGRFDIRDATNFDIPDAIDQDEDALGFVSHMQEHPALEDELSLLVQSLEPVQKTSKMYVTLLLYAQSFETFEPFKTERTFALQYLKPQYQRMSTAASHLVELVKDEKHSGVIFDCYGYRIEDTEESLAKCSLAVLLLEEYNASFSRDVPFHIKSIMCQNLAYYKRIYSEYGVSATLKDQLNTTIEIRNINGFIQDYKLAVDILDILCLTIRHAQKELFKWDPETLDDRRCSINPELERSEDMIQWEGQRARHGPDGVRLRFP